MNDYAIGIDVGGTKIAGGIVTFPAGTVTHKQVIPTDAARGAEAVLADTLALVENLLNQAQASGKLLVGIGLGVCELVDPCGNITSGFTIDWRGIPLQAILNDYAPSVVEADVRAHALAEAQFGAGRDYRIFTYLSVGTGISACLVQDRIPFAGVRGNALILSSGPITLVRDDGSSESQVLELFASGPAIAQRFGATRAEAVFEAAERGDNRAQLILSTAGIALGSSLGWLVNVLDPEAVIVGGGLGLAGGLFWQNLVDSTRKHIWSDDTRSLPILRAGLTSDSGIVGAAATAYRRFK